MWALRILSHSGPGTIYSLKMGRNLVGRADNCDISIKSNGISKEHAEIHVYKDKIIVVDLRSSNGTFLNGVRVQNAIVRIGDKIGLHDLIMDIIPSPELRAAPAPLHLAPQPQVPTFGSAAPAYPSQAYALQSQPELQVVLPQAPPQARTLTEKFEEYMERVALPGVYKLAEVLEFRLVLGSFIVMFIFAVTLLSMIPMVQLTRASITRESMRRASSLARSLAIANQQSLLQGSMSALSTHSVETEDGVKRALIVQQTDGVILAPASQAGNSPDLPFVLAARRDTKPQTAEIDGNTIGASFPIASYDPNTGESMVKAHAIILYDVSSLAFDDGRVLSLFFQTLVIAAILGLILFFFMYKLVEQPLVSLNTSLDKAMREKTDNIQSPLLFPPLQSLIGNVNSLLTRSLHGDDSPNVGFMNKDNEAINMLHWVGVAAIAFRSDRTIIACNPGFEALARNSSAAMAQHHLEVIQDIALQQNVEHLLNKAQENTLAIHNDQLEFGGHLCTLNCQAFVTNEIVDYFVVTITPVSGGNE